MKPFFQRALLAGLTAQALLATGMPDEDVIRVAKIGKGTLEVAPPLQLVLMEGMQALYADLSAAGLGTMDDWLRTDAPADLQNLRIDRSYGEPQTADAEFLQAMRDGQNVSTGEGVGISKPDLWESAAIKHGLGVDESKIKTVGKPPARPGKPGKPGHGKPGHGKPPVDPHNPPGPGAEIPEPSTWALLLSGGGAAIVAARRRRQ